MNKQEMILPPAQDKPHPPAIIPVVLKVLDIPVRDNNYLIAAENKASRENVENKDTAMLKIFSIRAI